MRTLQAQTVVRHLLSVLLGIVLGWTTLNGARADDMTAATTASQHPENTWQARRAQWQQARAERDANRLELKASQQAAWADYLKARQALHEGGAMGNTAAAEDAAAWAHQEADRAMRHAEKLRALAEATSRLQGVLTPEQQKVLTQIVRQHHRHHGHWHRHGHHRHHHHGHGGWGMSAPARGQ